MKKNMIIFFTLVLLLLLIVGINNSVLAMEENLIEYKGWGFSIQLPENYSVQVNDSGGDFIVYQFFSDKEKKHEVFSMYAGSHPSYPLIGDMYNKLDENFKPLDKGSAKIGDIDVEYIKGVKKDDESLFFIESLLKIKRIKERIGGEYFPDRLHAWSFDIALNQRNEFEKILKTVKANKNPPPPLPPRELPNRFLIDGALKEFKQYDGFGFSLMLNENICIVIDGVKRRIIEGGKGTIDYRLLISKSIILIILIDESANFGDQLKNIEEKEITINGFESRYKEENYSSGVCYKEIIINIPRDESERIFPKKIKFIYFNVSLKEKELLDKMVSTIKKNDLSIEEFIKRTEKWNSKCNNEDSR